MDYSRHFKWVFILLAVAAAQVTFAQVKVGDNASTIDAASVLEVESTTKGILFPRMTTTQMNAISSPPNGLMVYNITDSCLFYYHNEWLSSCDARTGGISISDNDSDTKVQVEESEDEDIIRFDVNGSETMRIESNKKIQIFPSSVNASSGAYFAGIHTDGRWGAYDNGGYRIFQGRHGYSGVGFGEGEAGTGITTSGIIVQNDYAIIPRLSISSSTTGPTNISRMLIERSNSSEWTYGSGYPHGENYYKITTSLTNAAMPYRRAPIHMGGYELKFHTGFSDNLRMTMDSTGNIGIGTSTPSEKLEVNGSIKMTDGNEGAGKILMSDANGVSTWSTPLAINDADGDTHVNAENSSDEDKIRFTTAGTERMIIDNSGNVGIGTSEPASAFEVKGFVPYIQSTTNSAYLLSGFVAKGDNTSNSGLTQYASSNSTTWDGISLTDGAQLGLMSASNAPFVLTTNSSSPLILGTKNEARMYFDTLGRVGIGLTRPEEILHIDANSDSLQIDNLAGSGNVLAIDDNGKVYKSSPTPSGVMQMFAGSSAPTGYLICDGSAVSRTTYANLYAVLGTTYGTGDGSTTFNLPDLRGRTAVGAGTGAYQNSGVAHSSSDALTAKSLGDYGGAEYTSGIALGGATGDNGTGNGEYIARNDGGANVFTATPPSSQKTASNSDGGNLQPYIVINYIIKF